MEATEPHHSHLSQPHCAYRGYRLWWVFLCSSVCLFLGGLLVLLIGKAWLRGFNRVRPKHCWVQREGITIEPVVRQENAMKEWAVSVLSAQHLSGKILMVLLCFFNIGSFLIYILQTTDPVESCIQEHSTAFLVDVGFNICFLLHFGLRFVAAQDALLVWVDIKSLVDFFTITPSFITLFTRRAWLGLRFIRALAMMELPVILQILNVFSSNTYLKLSHLIGIIAGTVLTSAGFIHLLENSGDPWLDNINPLSYFECVYFLIVTMSTVGYGDVEVRTYLGRLFIMIFVAIGLGLFASYVPEVVEIIVNRKRFGGSYNAISGKTHVVVCGHITLASASAFMKEFMHEDRGVVNIKVIFLGNFCPEPELEAFFRRQFLRATFYQGSVLQRQDQDRVMMHKASACLILCDRFTSHQHEDAANLMRVISIKQYCPNTRVIVQMLNHSSKAYLQNVPKWDWSRGDAVICLAELKLGFMAQSCLVPGLSTLLANLFTMQSNTELEGQTWQHLYRKGRYNEIYTEYLSSSFTGMSFAQASKLCFLKLKLLLIGIEYQSGDQEFSVLVNPPSYIKIKNQTLGFIIARNATDARRVNHYCYMCHSDIKDVSRMRPCKCSTSKDVSTSNSAVSLSCKRPSLGVLPYRAEQEWDAWQAEQQCVWGEKVKLDSTGMFHWCCPVPLQDVSLTRRSASVLALKGHVLVCVFGDERSPLLGLADFMMPLRASSLTMPELRTVVFLGSPEYFSREWPSIHYFPRIYFLPGSPLCGADLRALSVESCAMCVVLSTFCSAREDEPSMQDKEAILSCINLYHISSNQDQECGHSLNHSHSHRPALRHGYEPSFPQIPKADATPRTAIPLLVELVNSSNVQFVNEADRSEDTSCLTLTQAFSVGSVFSVDLLDSLMAATYFNVNIPALICTLVTGGDTPSLEAQMAEENQLQEGEMNLRMCSLRQRSKLAQLALWDEPLCRLACEDFKDLFCQALDSLEILCFGLYRLLDPPNPSMRRFVITHPVLELALLPSDKVFCSVPFHQSHLITRGCRESTNLYS